MGLFDQPAAPKRFPTRGKQYRQDIDWLCDCNHPACKRHEPGKCPADYLAGYQWLGKRKVALCAECVKALDAAFIEVRKRFPGQLSPEERY